MTFRPMLADKAPKEIQFPVYASPKIDGIRAVVKDGMLLSRVLKPIPNAFVQEYLGRADLNGLDGELTVGPANANNVMQATTSGVMSRDGEPNFTFHVFDVWNSYKASTGYVERYATLERVFHENYFEQFPRIVLLTHWLINDQNGLDAYEARMLAEGYEGVMIRKPDGLYKHGRSTAREGHLLKVKRFVDAEAVVIGYEEKMHNANAPTTNALGYMERSSHKGNKVAMGTLGALCVRNAEGVEFTIGTGLNDAQRAYIWACRDMYLGQIVCYKSFVATGVKDAPRHPVFKAWRHPLDVGDPK